MPKTKEEYIARIEINPHDYVTMFNLAVLYAEEKNYIKAAELFCKILNVPTLTTQYRKVTLSNLGFVYAALEDFKRAKDYCHQSIAAGELVAYRTMALVFEKQKNIAEARRFFNKGFYLNPKQTNSDEILSLGMRLFAADKQKYLAILKSPSASSEEKKFAQQSYDYLCLTHGAATWRENWRTKSTLPELARDNYVLAIFCFAKKQSENNAGTYLYTKFLLLIKMHTEEIAKKYSLYAEIISEMGQLVHNKINNADGVFAEWCKKLAQNTNFSVERVDVDQYLLMEAAANPDPLIVECLYSQMKQTLEVDDAWLAKKLFDSNKCKSIAVNDSGQQRLPMPAVQSKIELADRSDSLWLRDLSIFNDRMASEVRLYPQIQSQAEVKLPRNSR